MTETLKMMGWLMFFPFWLMLTGLLYWWGFFIGLFIFLAIKFIQGVLRS